MTAQRYQLALPPTSNEETNALSLRAQGTVRGSNAGTLRFSLHGFHEGWLRTGGSQGFRVPKLSQLRPTRNCCIPGASALQCSWSFRHFLQSSSKAIAQHLALSLAGLLSLAFALHANRHGDVDNISALLLHHTFLQATIPKPSCSLCDRTFESCCNVLRAVLSWLPDLGEAANYNNYRHDWRKAVTPRSAKLCIAKMGSLET